MSQNICISGASRGIGLGLTRHFLRAGHQVWALVRNPDKAEELGAVARDFPNSLHLVKADVAHEADAKEVGRYFQDKTLDILINNAGVMVDPSVPFSEIPLDVFRKTFETNVWGAVSTSQALLPALKRSKARPVLAMMSSQMGSLAENKSGGYYAYRTSKAALNMIVKNLSQECPWLTVVTLHPGWVQTDMGGSQAPTSVDESTQGLIKVLTQLKPEQSGSFLDYKGRVLPW